MNIPHRTVRDALVVWWNKALVYVRCPFCDDIHYHDFTEYNELGRSILHVPHCDLPKGSYYITIFPFNKAEDWASYYVDQERGLFVAVGEDPSEYFEHYDNLECEQILAQAKNALKTKPRWAEAVERIDITEVKQLDLMLACLIDGELQAVHQFLVSSKEVDLLLSGVEESMIYPSSAIDYDLQEGSEEKTHLTGWTALHVAARERCPEAVELLLEHGADPNARGADGRTPLVEACLWGRLENVKLLLEHGADKNVPSVGGCPRRLRLPVDYARESKENDESRYYLSDGGNRENIHERDNDRKAIVTLLEDACETQSANRNQRRLSGFRFEGSLPNTAINTFLTLRDIPGSKTIGFLLRADFPIVGAMSGWNHPESNSIQLAGEYWTRRVGLICEAVDFQLLRHDYDRGYPGKYHACHAEKQLLAYFVDHHPPYEAATERVKGKLWPETSGLKEVRPSTSVRQAVIVVNHPECRDCGRFRQRLNEVFGLDIVVRLFQAHL